MYRAVYVTCFEDEVTFRRTVLCDLTQIDSVLRQCVYNRVGHPFAFFFWNRLNVIYGKPYAMSFQHEIVFRRTVLCDPMQTDRKVRLCVSGWGQSTPYIFFNQLNASYRTAYVTCFEREVTFGRTALCELTQAGPSVSPCVSGRVYQCPQPEA